MCCKFQSNDPNMKSSQAITKFLPLMIGYFALSVPSGLSLYWWAYGETFFILLVLFIFSPHHFIPELFLIFLSYYFRFTNNILSTAQQVWLQKLGGANISKRAIAEAEDILKEDQLQTQKSVPALNSTRKEDRKEEKLTSEGLLPGERLIFVTYYYLLAGQYHLWSKSPFVLELTNLFSDN